MYNQELVQYFVVNTDIGMVTEKIVSKVSQASTIIALRDQHQENFIIWKDTSMKQIILGSPEERIEELMEIPNIIRILDESCTGEDIAVIGLPVMTRKEAYRWVHGMKNLRLRHEGMTYNDTQAYIKQESENKSGIFYLPELGEYSATCLVNNPHPIQVIEETATKWRIEDHIEHGDIGYIIGEIMFNLNKTVGPYYAYKTEGKHNHDHYIEGVYRDAAVYYSTFEFEEPVEEYFSGNESKVINSIIEYQKQSKGEIK